MHESLYKYGKDNCEYMIFCDLDEYMYVENNYTLKQLINEYPEHNSFCFQNIWSETLDGNIPTIFPEEFYIGEKTEYGLRNKNIHKVDKLYLVPIHGHDSRFELNGLILFHFYNWSKSTRKESTHTLYSIKI